MRLSWNEIRRRAAAFSEEWKEARYEKGETQSFYNKFFGIFGVRRRSVARYEERVEKLDSSSGFIDLFWPGVLLVEQKSAGRSLEKAYEQAGEYFDSLPESQRPRYILLSDFQNFELYDFDERNQVKFSLADLPAHVEEFAFILGVQRRIFRDQDPANITAAELVGHLYDSLSEACYPSHDLERFLVRVVFCLFADDTGVFEPRDIFLEFIETRTKEDGSDLGALLTQIFQVLDTPVEKRTKTLDEDLSRFPYVNGELFQEPLIIPSFTADMRARLLDACRFDWSKISPAIFGALFQSVMDPEERRVQGAHYTTEKNILKVIEPLFLDNLRAEFEHLKALKRGRTKRLREFQEKLTSLTFFDPACGCGNFLVIAYRELRLLEIEVIREIRSKQGVLYKEILSEVDVNQFYGIELGEFPVRIAETALWMMDHIMNNLLSLEFCLTYARIPLTTSPHILQGDALETDWTEVLSPDKCSFVFGNPPFGGFVMRTKEKQSQAKELMRKLGASGSRLDYVAAWFLKAGDYFRGNKARIGFVATNSITQGEQVAYLWPALFGRYGLEIAFAHRTFSWNSEARGVARVHVVIIGLSDRKSISDERRLFTYEKPNKDSQEIRVAAINPYLVEAGQLNDVHTVVKRQRVPFGNFPKICVGTKPVDGGHYIFGEEEKKSFVGREPRAASLFRPFVGAEEYINGRKRWILHVSGEPPNLLKSLPDVMNRIHAVRQYRANESGKLGQSLAGQPTEYHVSVIPEKAFLVIPETSSEHRQYVPIGWLHPPSIPSNSLLVVQNAELWQFALLTSALHMTWLRYVGGRLESRYRYSTGLVYNTFPIPPKGADLSKLKPLAKAILDARAEHKGVTLADLYDSDLMPKPLRRAHKKLDRAVDHLYKRGGFSSERERIEHLFSRYEKMLGPLQTSIKKKPKRRRRVAVRRK